MTLFLIVLRFVPDPRTQNPHVWFCQIKVCTLYFGRLLKLRKYSVNDIKVSASLLQSFRKNVLFYVCLWT